MALYGKGPVRHRKHFIVFALVAAFAGLMGIEVARPSVSDIAQEDLPSIIRLLSSTASGRKLLLHAQRQWRLPSIASIAEKLQWSSVSRTDAVLTRHLDTVSGQEVRDREVTIYLKRHDNFMDTVIDFAHELTHASAGPTWDPYDPELTPGKYIWHAIEGPGGEVDAVVAECQVALELEKSQSVPKDRCRRYETAGSISREKVKQDFYKVGVLRSRIADTLGSEVRLFPLLSSTRAELFSSTGKAPYPVALYEEFMEMNRMACDNSRKRMGLLRTSTRSPASQSSASRGQQRGERSRSRELTQRFLSRRCAND